MSVTYADIIQAHLDNRMKDFFLEKIDDCPFVDDKSVVCSSINCDKCMTKWAEQQIKKLTPDDERYITWKLGD